MADVRAALKTKLESLTYDGENPAGFDFGSTDLTLENFERMVLSEPGDVHYVGIALGDQSTTTEPFSFGVQLNLTEIDVLIVERRPAQVGSFPEYVDDMASGIDRDSLSVANVLDVNISKVGEIQKEVADGGVSTFYQIVTIAIKHYVNVNLQSDFRINVDLPTITIDESVIDTWVGEGMTGTLTFDAVVVSGTGTPTNIIMFGQFDDNPGEAEKIIRSFALLQAYTSDTTYTTSVDSTLAAEIIEITEADFTFYALVYDQYGAMAIDSYQVTTPA